MDNDTRIFALVLPVASFWQANFSVICSRACMQPDQNAQTSTGSHAPINVICPTATVWADEGHYRFD